MVSLGHNEVKFNITYGMTMPSARYTPDYEPTNDPQYLTLVGELWGVFNEYLGGK